MFQERRRAPRIAKHLVAQYLAAGTEERWNMTEVKNFSEVGLLITTDEDFRADTKLRFRIKLPINPFHWYELDGKVVTCDKNVTGAYPTSKVASFLVRIEILNASAELKSVIHDYVAWYLSKGGTDK